jgi:hypothetical protein
LKVDTTVEVPMGLTDIAIIKETPYSVIIASGFRKNNSMRQEKLD